MENRKVDGVDSGAAEETTGKAVEEVVTAELMAETAVAARDGASAGSTRLPRNQTAKKAMTHPMLESRIGLVAVAPV